ncbi:MAG: DUF4398 domain-containing protein [Chromatiales bacterium]|jgi:hypothetical protein|nr:MAG: DUF4398 domain-containing protein [Chromatiales bacterium]
MTLPETLRRLLPCLALLGISACTATGPPVQEMSDARQAIAAAREAGAVTLASDSLVVAETRLAEAEGQLQDRMYWNAKRLALAAKESAIAALLRSRSLREAGAAATSDAPSP